MKLLYSILGAVSLSSVASAAAFAGMEGVPLLEQVGAAAAPVYINALGEVVIPQKFHWGSYAVKELDSAKPRKCAHHQDFGRLGKRQSCQYGYEPVCPSNYQNPCCPTNSPTCCSQESTVCCGADQFCQGTTTCCNNGQTGCGEACCDAGTTCCGTKCCGYGYTCSNGSCIVPPGSTTSPSVSPTVPVISTPAETRSSTGTGGGTTTSTSTGTGSTTSTTTTSSSTTTTSNGGGNDQPPKGPSPQVIGGAVGGSIAGLILLCGIAAFCWRRNRATPPPTDKPTEYKPPTTEKPHEGYEPTAPPENQTPMNYERSAGGAPPVSGHGANYE